MPSVTYQPAQSDPLAAQRLHNLSTILGWRPAAFLLVYAVGVFAVVWSSDGTTGVALVLAGAAALLFVGPLALAQLVRPRLIARRQFREQRNLRDAYTIGWSEAGYAIRGPTGFTELAWGHYWRWREDGRVILLYQSRYMYQFVPKRLLPPGEVEVIRGWLRAAGVPRARSFLS